MPSLVIVHICKPNCLCNCTNSYTSQKYTEVILLEETFCKTYIFSTTPLAGVLARTWSHFPLETFQVKLQVERASLIWYVVFEEGRRFCGYIEILCLIKIYMFCSFEYGRHVR